MPIKKDIETKQDIKLLVDAFYEKVRSDKTIGYIFSDVAKLNFAEHMPKMYDFWETTLFHKIVYKGNPMDVHLKLNSLETLKKAHFDQWLYLFNETIDELFSGTISALAKTRALSIATVMQIKLAQQSQQQ